MKYLALATSIALIAAGAIGGYVVGGNSGEEPEATPATAGQKLGAAVGAGRGFNTGFDEGRQAGFRDAYLESYRSAYRRSWAEQGLDPLGPNEPSVSEISVPVAP